MFCRWNEESYESNFQSKRNRRPLAHRPLGEGHQRGDVLRGGAAAVDDEVRVDLGDLRAAFDAALEPRRFDELARVVVGRVAEDRARVRQVERLRLLAV